MEKVKVSKEVFYALENLKKRVGEESFKKELNWCVIKNDLRDNELVLYSKVPVVQLVDIAYCGYELEETPEELFLKEYIELKIISEKSKNPIKSEKAKDAIFTINKVLELLEIKIKGVND